MTHSNLSAWAVPTRTGTWSELRGWQAALCSLRSVGLEDAEGRGIECQEKAGLSWLLDKALSKLKTIIDTFPTSENQTRETTAIRTVSHPPQMHSREAQAQSGGGAFPRSHSIPSFHQGHLMLIL